MDQASWSAAAGQVIDSSGNAFHGSAVNGAQTAGTTPAIAGNPGSCRYGALDGINDYVDIGTASALTFTNKITVSAWVRWNISPAAGNNWANLVSANSSTVGDNGQFWLQHSTSNGKYEFAVQTTGGRTYVIGTVSPIQGQWQYVTGTYDGATLRVYVNGVLAGSVAKTGNLVARTSAMPINIGRWAYSSQNFRAFNGLLDEVRIYNEALTPAQIASVMSQTHPCS
jgi:MSHA biogenesis protein MshQ